MASSSNRHPIVLLGAAASLITVLSFFGIRGWPGSEPTVPVPVASTGPAAPAVAAVQSSTPAPSPSPTCDCPAPTPTPAAVSCVVEDRLGEGQVAETVSLRFGAKEWELSIDESDPTDRLALRFPRAGTYDYTVTTETETSDGDTVHGEGEGSITCRGGQTFQVVGDYSSYPLTVSLMEA